MNHVYEELVRWCQSTLGICEFEPIEKLETERSTSARVSSEQGFFYLKVFSDPARWSAESHAYENWTNALRPYAPNFIASRDTAPLAILTSAKTGENLATTRLPTDLERGVWRQAGKALAEFHALGTMDAFSTDQSDTTMPFANSGEPVSFITSELELERDRAVATGSLTKRHLKIISAAQRLASSFEGEAPVPCHRDYQPDNWIVSPDGELTGIIDFELSRWDVRMADFTRYPNWESIVRPDLTEAFFDGYGRNLTQAEEEQRLVSHTIYALSAINWGTENSFDGFVREGHLALSHLAKLLNVR